MVHLYDQKVQDRVVTLGLTTREEIRQRSVRFKLQCIPGYLVYVILCVYLINGARGFLAGFWQGFVILSIMNLIDRFLIDEFRREKANTEWTSLNAHTTDTSRKWERRS